MEASNASRTSLTDTVLVNVPSHAHGAVAAEPSSESGRRDSLQHVLALGTLVGSRYEVLQHLGDGGMGIVYLAHDRQTGDRVALKVMREEFRRASDFLRFRHEYYLMATLRHPHLVEVRELTVVRDTLPCLVMEYVPGDDLTAVLPLGVPEAISVLQQMASALAFLHSRRYIHHDLKPSNVRVFRKYPGGPLSAKLIDFGIMEPLGTTRRYGLVGTPAYLPPEVLLHAPADQRLDLYSLGVMAFEMLTNRLPFKSTAPDQFFIEKQFEPPDVHALLPELPEPLAALLTDMLAPDPSDRPYDANIARRRLAMTSSGELSRSAEHDAPPYLHACRLVGRDEELALFARACRTSSTGPVLLRFSAGAGLGKTALLRELVLRARLSGARTAEANGGADLGPFGAVRALLSELLRSELVFEGGFVQEHGPVLARIAPVIAEEWRVAPAEPAAEPSEDRSRFFRSIRAFCRELVKSQDLVLCVDDAHLTDSASLEALRALGADDELKRLVIVLALRPSELVNNVFATAGAVEQQHVTLPCFDEADVAALLQALFGQVESFPKFVSELARAGQHNPSLLLELIRHLVAERCIEFHDERWHVPRELGAMRLPGSLREALTARAGELDPSTRAVLNVLVVAGGELDIQTLQECAALPEHELFAALDRLVGAELIVTRGDAYLVPGSTGHDLYESIPGPERVRLHQRLGDALERRPSAPKAHRAAELARHFKNGELPLRAKPHLAEACREFYTAQALPEALQHLLELETLLTSLTRDGAALPRADRELLHHTRTRLARVGVSLDPDVANRYLLLERRAYLARVPEPTALPARSSRLAELVRLTVAELGAALADPARLLSARQRMIGYFTATSFQSASLAVKGSFAESLAVAEALAPFVAGPRSRGRAAYDVCLAIPYTHQGRVRDAEVVIRRALSLLGDPKLMAGVSQVDLDSGFGGLYVGITLCYSARGRPEARQWLSLFEGFVRERQSMIGFLLPNLFLAQIDYHLHRGELLSLEQVEARYKAHHAQNGCSNAHLERQILVGLARAALARDKLLVAEGLCGELSRHSPPDFFSHGWGAAVSGELWRAQRLYDRAESALSGALEYATRPGARCFKLELRARNALAELAFEKKRYDVAEEHARSALAIAESAEARSEYEEVWARKTLNDVAIKRGDAQRSLEQVTILRHLGNACDNPLFCALASKAFADRERTFGESTDYGSSMATARQMFESLGYLAKNLTSSSRLRTPGASSSWAQSTGSSPPSHSAETIIAESEKPPQ